MKETEMKMKMKESHLSARCAQCSSLLATRISGSSQQMRLTQITWAALVRGRRVDVGLEGAQLLLVVMIGLFVCVCRFAFVFANRQRDQKLSSRAKGQPGDLFAAAATKAQHDSGRDEEPPTSRPLLCLLSLLLCNCQSFTINKVAQPARLRKRLCSSCRRHDAAAS